MKEWAYVKAGSGMGGMAETDLEWWWVITWGTGTGLKTVNQNGLSFEHGTERLKRLWQNFPNGQLIIILFSSLIQALHGYRAHELVPNLYRKDRTLDCPSASHCKSLLRTILRILVASTISRRSIKRGASEAIDLRSYLASTLYLILTITSIVCPSAFIAQIFMGTFAPWIYPPITVIACNQSKGAAFCHWLIIILGTR